MESRIRVLVVDDSALMRKLVTEMVAQAPDMEVVAQARDGFDALDKIEKLRPDVVTLDVEMPNMDGLQTLTEIMKRRPMPVVMLSSLTQAGAKTTIECLSKGAFDFVAKPSGSISLDIAKVSEELVTKIRHSLASKHKATTPAPFAVRPPPPVFRLPETIGESRRRTSLIVIGSSTGGPRALQAVVPFLPGDLGVAVVVVQHMPPNFTASLANRLNDMSSLTVREAAEGDRLEPGVVLVARGGNHLEFNANGVATLTDSAPVHGVRPSIDVTLASLVPNFGARMMGVILTGMGRDGAAGLKAVRAAGGQTIAEDESTCVVYGMPKAAHDMDAAQEMVPLPDVADAIVRKLVHAPASISAA